MYWLFKEGYFSTHRNKEKKEKLDRKNKSCLFFERNEIINLNHCYLIIFLIDKFQLVFVTPIEFVMELKDVQFRFLLHCIVCQKCLL